MKVIFHENFYQVYTSDPAASAGRMEAIVQAISSHVKFVEGQPASEKQIALAHDKSHIENVRQRGLFEIAALAAGSAIQTATIGLSEPCFGLIRPPGHHASSVSCWGFCYFNNMAVSLMALKRQKKINTAHVLDFDLHYGDGTVNILGGRDYVTVHNPEAATREAYLEEISREMSECQADIIGISAGFDNHQEDWGGLLRTEDYEQIGKMVREAALRIGGGCFAILEGGYNHDVLGENVLALINGLSDSPHI
jgi:acetoin utilization deacetylase AcuC-like enzyme